MANPSRAFPGFPTLPAFIAGHLATWRSNALCQLVPSDGLVLNRTYSTRDVHNRAAAVAHALRARGIASGDRVAIMAENRLDWLVADFGILYAGAVVVPMFATTAGDQLAYILADAAIKLVFVDDAAAAARVHAASPSVDVVVFASEGTEGFEAFVASGMPAHEADAEAVAALTAAADPEDLAVLIYTSGTTGMPKGVMLCHRNLTSNAQDAYSPEESRFAPGNVMLTVLPLAHIYAHTNALGYLQTAVEHWVTTPERLMHDMLQLRPHCIAFVPRIFERILAAIVGKARAKGGLQARLVPWALETGAAHERVLRDGGTPSPALRASFAVARALVLKKIKPALGFDRLMYFVSGSAPLHRDTALAFAAMGLDIVEGYGQTETSPVATVNRPATNTLGTVGKPIRNVQIRLGDDGEVQVYGPDVMLGYYKVPEAEQPFTADGWLLTGDIGRFDDDGNLIITDRKREIFKTSGGKWVAPARIESAIKRSVSIGQVMAFGDNRPHPAALVAPNWDLVRAELGIGKDVGTADMSRRDDVRALMVREVREHTADLAPYEQVHRVAVLPRDLTIEDGELSPTLKVRRREVEQRYAPLIEAAYAEDLHKRTAGAAS